MTKDKELELKELTEEQKQKCEKIVEDSVFDLESKGVSEKEALRAMAYETAYCIISIKLALKEIGVKINV